MGRRHRSSPVVPTPSLILLLFPSMSQQGPRFSASRAPSWSRSTTRSAHFLLEPFCGPTSCVLKLLCAPLRCFRCCRFYFQVIVSFLGFPFTTTVWSTFGALPFVFGIRMEAGSETTSIRSSIRDSVNAKLDALKKSGEGAITNAMNQVSKAQNDVNGICEVREPGVAFARAHTCSRTYHDGFFCEHLFV